MKSVFKLIKVSGNDILLIVSAFLAYTGMYAVRKSFLAAHYSDVVYTSAIGFKTILVISQLVGYMLSKFIGIKVVAETKPENRVWALLGLVSFGLLMLLLFAYVPVYIKPWVLFLNGLPLGIVFGLLLSYLEGRRNTELLVVGLTATFIFSTGFIKTTGVWLMSTFLVDEYLMPFVVGVIFFPLFVASVILINKSKPPNEEDQQLRTKREPMNAESRRNFLQTHGVAFFGLVLIYVLLSVLRDFRDSFIVEFWADMGESGRDSLLTMTEVPIAIVVLVICGLGVLIVNNRVALIIGMLLTIISACFMFLVSYLFAYGMVSPLWWTVLSGGAIYLPYVLFHCLVFERFIAFLRFKGTVGYLFYIGDALGYLGSLFVLLFKELLRIKYSFVDFFLGLNVWGGLAILGVSVLAAILLQKKKHLFYIPKVAA